MTRLKEKKEFKREYIPVIVTGIILILLVGALVFMVLYKGKLDLEDVPTDSGHKVDELNVEVDKDKCSTDLIKKLSNEANKIKMSYKEKTIEGDLYYDPEETAGENFFLYDHIWNVKFDNVTDNFYLKITNDSNDTIKTITKDTLVDGKWEFDTIVDDDVVTYTISVISNPEGCKEQVFREFELKALIFNVWSSSSKCTIYKDFKYCKRWIDEDVPTWQKFENELAKYIKDHPEIKETNPYGVSIPTATASTNKDNKKTSTTKKKESNTSSKNSKTNKENNNKSKDNIIVYAAIVVLIIVAGVVIVVLLKKNRSK